MHVDDDPSSLEISKQILMDMGNFEIDNACCVEDAFKKLAAGNFDVVVSDYEMPKKDGLQFLMELRKSKNEIPFILFTGKGREEVAVKALNLGADGYINKQGNPETVYGELKHVILNSLEKRIAQEMLRQSEERFKNLVTNSKDVIMLTQADGVILFLSPSCKNVLGYEPNELVGKIPWIIHPDDLERVQKVFQSALTTKLNETLEYRILTKQGETKWVNHTFSQLWENGKLKQIVSNLTDITESKKTEEAITQSESQYRLLADNVHDVIWTMDLEGRFTYVSPSVLQLRGYSPDDVLQQSMVEALTPDSARIVLEDLQRFWETGAVPSDYYELEQYCKDGSTVWTEVNFTVLRNRDGKPKAFLGVSRNIAERKKAEGEMKRKREALRESEERFRTIFEGASEGILVADVKAKSFVFANFAMCELTGYSLKELLLLGVDDIDPREDLSNAVGEFVNQTKGKVILATNIPVLRKDGKVVYCDVNSKVSRFGNQECLVGFFRDTSERKQCEIEEKAKSKEIRGIIDGIGDLLFVMDKNRVITKVNKATCDAFRKEPEELIGRHCYEIVHGTKAPWCNCPATKTFETKQIVTEEVNDPNLGIPLLVTTSPILNDRGEITQVIHIAKDITTLKLAEMEMHISANLFDAASDSIMVHDLDGKLLYFNEAAHKTRGYTKEEFQALSIQDLEAPSKSEFFGSQMKELLDNGEATFEAANLCKDKTVIPVEIHAQVIEFDDQNLVLREARDISERKAAEEKLWESQEKYETTFESSMDALMLLDEKGFFDCNTATLSLFGYTSVEEFTKNHPADLSPTLQPDGSFSLELANNHIKKALYTGKDSFFWVHKRTDGTTFPADVLLTRLHLNNRDVLQATVRDVTELKKAQDEQSRLLHDMGERVKELNCIYGISKIFEKSDVVLKNALIETVKLLPLAMQYPDIACAKILVENQTFSTKNFNETQWILQSDVNVNGKRTGFVEINYLEERPAVGEGPFTIEERNLIDVVAERLGKTIERKQAETDLKQAEEKHRTLLTAANVLVQSVDAEGKFVFVNEEWKKTLGYTDIDLEGITIMNTIQKDHLQYCMNVFKQVMNGTCIRDVETVFVTKIGKEIVVSGNACPIFKDGEFVSTVAFFVDITERKKNEKKLEESNQRIELMNEKLRVVGSLTRHDVRNKLSAVTGYAYLLKKKHADQADIMEGLSKMEQAVKETVRIFEFAKMYEQLGAEELTYIDVEAKLNEATTLFSGSLAKIINECHGLTVLADSFLRQLFYNFIDNTRKYGQKTTTIKVHCEKTSQDSLKLVYEDDGVGISTENKPKLFSEGFSTGGSTGFGLFLTKKMIDVYGWGIEENGEPSKGAKFTITIPKLNKSGKENYQTA